jgi:hypothetical protein
MGSLSIANATTIADFGYIAAKFHPAKENKITAN